MNMKITTYTLLAFALMVNLESCVNHHIRKGNESFENLAFKKAVEHYSKATKKEANLTVQARLAESYFKMNDLVNAEKTYSPIINSTGIEQIHYLNYSRVLIGTGKCDKAQPWLIKYMEKNSSDFLAKTLLASCKSINDRMIDTTLYTLQPIILDEYTNSFSAVEYQNGIVFTADKTVFQGKKQNPWTGNSYLGLFEMQKDENGNWLDPVLLQGDINGPFHDGPATFTGDGQTVYFTRNNYFKKQLKVDENNTSNLKIFKASLINGEWKQLEEFPFNSDDYSNGHPSVSQDGKTMFFVSDMPGGFGGTDIYVTYFDGTKWSAPKNLGNTINTPGNEMFPYIHHDGSLYFSSDAHNSMGGLDVFITSIVNEQWLQPENLNYPLNSSKDDFAFTLSKDNKTGFVSSMRTDADKVYSFTKNAPTFNLIGMSRKKGSEEPVEGVTVQVTNTKTGEVITISSGKNGKFKLPCLQKQSIH
jgi:peptidoglycan-associated lipoprotein